MRCVCGRRWDVRNGGGFDREGQVGKVGALKGRGTKPAWRGRGADEGEREEGEMGLTRR